MCSAELQPLLTIDTPHRPLLQHCSTTRPITSATGVNAVKCRSTRFSLPCSSSIFRSSIALVSFLFIIHSLITLCLANGYKKPTPPLWEYPLSWLNHHLFTAGSEDVGCGLLRWSRWEGWSRSSSALLVLGWQHWPKLGTGQPSTTPSSPGQLSGFACISSFSVLHI